jgi:hypothetical protein
MSQKLKDLLGKQIVAVPAILTTRFGSTTAILLSQFLYWHERNENDGWFWNTQAKLQSQTGLTDEMQASARKKLKALGVLEECRRGMPARLEYKINVEKLEEIIISSNALFPTVTRTSFRQSREQESNTGTSFRQSRGTSFRQSRNLPNKEEEITEEITHTHPTLESERLGDSKPDLETASNLDSDTPDLGVRFDEEKTVESQSIATTATTDLGKKRGGAATRAANAEAAGSAARAKLEQIEGFTVLWEKYEKVRAEKRQKLTPTARGEALEMLLEHPKPLEVIRYTVANGYTGLVFDKFRETKTTPNSVVEPETQAPTAKGIPEGENSPGMYRTPNGHTIKVFNSYAGFVWLDESGDRSIPERETVGWRKTQSLPMAKQEV